MRAAPIALGLVATIVAGLGCARLSSPEPPVPSVPPGTGPDAVLESGADLYASYCASCHGVLALGDGPAGAALRPAPSDLTRLAPHWGDPLDRERLADFVDGRGGPRAHGPPGMPVWGERLYAGERPESPAREAARRGTILLIVEYLQTLQKPDAAPAAP